MRCLTCKYDLSNLTEHRCPECGRAFDPKDSSTYRFGPDGTGQKLWVIVVMILFAMQAFLFCGGLEIF